MNATTLDDLRRARGSATISMWQVPNVTTRDVETGLRPTKILVYKGDPVPNTSTHTLIPRDIMDAPIRTIVLSSPPITLAGSFAPAVTDANLTYIPTTDSVTIYFDGTNGSDRLKQRRADGNSETLPAGQMTITGLTPSAPGAATGPSYELIMYYIPGTCHVGFIKGNAGTPAFLFNVGTTTPDDINKAQSEGREPITAGSVTITLLPVPLPPPPDPNPTPTTGSQTGNTSTNGSLSVTTDVPGQGAIQNITFTGSAHASDSAGRPITGWNVTLDDNPTPIFQGAFASTTPNVSFTVNTSPGNHNLKVKGYNADGLMAMVSTDFSTQDLSSGGTQPPPSPTPDPTPTPSPTPIPSCVMLGTVIDTLGPSQWHTQQMPNAEWMRLFTERGHELMATPDHPIVTMRAGRTEMRDVRKGDLVVCSDGEDRVLECKPFVRPGIKVKVYMDTGHLFWANGVLSHNVKPRPNQL